MAKKLKISILLLGCTIHIVSTVHAESNPKGPAPPKGSPTKSIAPATANSPCKLLSGILNLVPGATTKQTDGKFEFGMVKYQGCSFRLEGKWSAMEKDLHPTDLIYPSEPDSKLYKEGWHADFEADGPDGTFFRIRKGSVFCFVTGSWDGGDESDPENKPKDEYTIEVQCAEQKVK